MNNRGPDFALKCDPLPKGSGQTKMLPATCPNCYKRIPPSSGIGRRGPYVDTSDIATKTRKGGALKRLSHELARCASRVYNAPEDCALEARIEIRFVKPKSVKRDRPTKEADLDKLVRTVLDAIQGVAYTNDARVCRLVAEKTYADAPGVAVRIRRIDGQAAIGEGG